MHKVQSMFQGGENHESGDQQECKLSTASGLHFSSSGPVLVWSSEVAVQPRLPALETWSFLLGENSREPTCQGRNRKGLALMPRLSW